MSPLRTLVAAGLSVSADVQRRLIVRPASRITDKLRLLVRENKAALLAELDAAHNLTAQLVAAIKACGDLRGDDAANRAALIEEARHQRPEGQADLREHFQEQADMWAQVTGRATR